MRQYEFSDKVMGYKTLLEIYELLDDKIEIIDKVLILPDNYEEIIGDRQSKLTKKFYSYKNKLFNKAYTHTEYLEFQEKQRQRKIAEQQQKKQIELKKQWDVQYLEQLKKEYGKNWRDKKWIEENIGRYYNFEPCMEYYWTIIGDNFKYIKGGNIILENEIYKIIDKDKSFNITGKSFLNRRFNRYGRSKDILNETYYKEEKVQSCGVYGIYINDELMYIGSTMRNFESRFKEHRENIQNRSKELYFYDLINLNKDKIEFKILIDIMKLKTNLPFTRKDVESMELALISVSHPRGNLADGVKYEFKYRNKT